MASVSATLSPTARLTAVATWGDLEGVGEAGALVIGGVHEDLGLPGQAPEGGGVQDAVAVALEAGAQGVGLLGQRPFAGAPTAGGALGESGLLELLADRPVEQAGG